MKSIKKLPLKLTAGLSVLFFFAAASIALAQPTWTVPPIIWQHTYGGSLNDKASDIHPTNDGGYIIIGYTYSSDSDVTQNRGQSDVWIVKTDSMGEIMWQHSYGGSGFDFGQTIQQTTDSGYIVGATTFSNDFDVSGNHGQSDFWIFKIDSVGTMKWSKVYGGSLSETLYAVKQTTNGFVACGTTNSVDGDVHGNHGMNDVWLLRLSNVGDTVWTKCMGGSNDDYGRAVLQAVGGDYVVAGSSRSNDGDLTKNNGGSDYWIVKVDAPSDTIIWQYTYGGSYDEDAYGIIQNSAQGYLVVGSSYSNDSDVTGHAGPVGAIGIGTSDLWTVKLTNVGTLFWQDSRGGVNDEVGYDAVQDPDSGYTIAGYSRSNLAMTSPNNGLADMWLIKIDRFSNRQWGEVYGGSDYDYCYSIDELDSARLIIAGFTLSNDSDVTNNHGMADFWALKLGAAINTTGIDEHSDGDNEMVKVYPNPFNSSTKIVISSPDLHSKRCILNIYNMQGALIRSFDAGDRTVINLDKKYLTAGMFYYQLIADGVTVSTGKLVSE